jgi:sporulation protein YlmC with PRC-barrel domain
MKTKQSLMKFAAVAAAASALSFGVSAQDAEGKVKIGDAEGKAELNLPNRDNDKKLDLNADVNANRDRTGLDAQGDARNVGAAKINKASGLMGMEVRNHQNENLGNISDIVFDLNSGKISYVVLGVGGFLGIGEKLIAVPPSAFARGVDESYVLLNADKLRIQNAPGFVKTSWPNPHDWRGGDYWKDVEVGGTAGVDTGRGTRSELNDPLRRSGSADVEVQANRRSSEERNLRAGQETRRDLNDKDAMVFHGRITSVNPEQRTISIEGENGSRTFKVESQSALQVRNQKATSLTDFKVGQSVSVRYHEKDGDHVADHVMTTTVVEPK